MGASGVAAGVTGQVCVGVPQGEDVGNLFLFVLLAVFFLVAA